MSVVEHAPEQVFEELYDRYARDVYRYALAVLRNPADAEDVAQTTFMNAYRAIKRGERPQKPQHWLIVIAHNACRTRAIRAARRPREVPLDDTVRDVPVPESERPNLRAVLEALGRLPFNQRSALVMRELEGRSYEEIAETLGVTVAAVETLIFRARRSLRLRKDALRGLAVVQLPASLQSFGGSVVAGAGAFLGGGVALKAAAVVAAVIAGGATLEAVQSTMRHHRAHTATAEAPVLFAGSLHARERAARSTLGAGARTTAGARGVHVRHRKRLRGAGVVPPGMSALPAGASSAPAAQQTASAATSGSPAGAPGAAPLPVPSVLPVPTATLPASSVPVPPVPIPPVPVPPAPAPPGSTPTVPSAPGLPTTPGVTVPQVPIPPLPPTPTVTVTTPVP